LHRSSRGLFCVGVLVVCMRAVCLGLDWSALDGLGLDGVMHLWTFDGMGDGLASVGVLCLLVFLCAFFVRRCRWGWWRRRSEHP
jgi:hypothetical protein